MKKILLGTTAVVALATISTEAFAADKIQLGLGGFMRHYVGVINDDEVASDAPAVNRNRAMSLSQYSNTEVYFSGSTTLDNGLSVKAVVEMEADGENTTNNTDKSYLTVSSDALGALTLGVTAHAIDDMDVRAPNASNFDWGDLDDWAQMADTAAADNTSFSYIADGGYDFNGDNAAKLKYISPTFSGVTVFASYSAAEGSGAYDARRLDRNGTEVDDGSSFGVAYSGEVGGASVKASLGQYRSNGVENDTQFGLSVGMAGFTVGGSYVHVKDDDGSSTNANSDGKSWELGVAYATGPYALSAGYMQSKNDGSDAVGGENKDKVWNVAATYDMGASVKLAANYFHATRDGENTTASPTTFAAGKSATVSGVIAGIEVGF